MSFTSRPSDEQDHVAELVDPAGPRSSGPAASDRPRSSPGRRVSDAMSFVSSPCRYDARSAPGHDHPRIAGSLDEAGVAASRGVTGSMSLERPAGIMDAMLRFMRLCSILSGRAARLVAIAVAADGGRRRRSAAQTPPSTFTVFVRSTPIGSEQVAVERTARRMDDHEQRPGRAAGRSHPATRSRRGTTPTGSRSSCTLDATLRRPVDDCSRRR